MQSSEWGTVEIRPARSLADFLFLRKLRNAVRANMTNDTGSIGYLQQLRFFLNTPRNIRIFIARVGGRRAGYLLLRDSADGTLITEAVDAAFRGRGVATALVRYAQTQCPLINAEILAGNNASIRLHESTGFQRSSERDGIVCYRHER